MNEAINVFITKAKTANAMDSKELRLPIKEAVDLSLSISEILVTNVKLSDRVRQLEQLLGETIKIDGGKL